MRKFRWLNLFIFSVCLTGQLIGFQVQDRPVTESAENYLTEADESGVALEFSISQQAPLSIQISKYSAVLASSRFSYQRSTFLQSFSAFHILYRSVNADLIGVLAPQSADNRGPPLV